MPETAPGTLAILGMRCRHETVISASNLVCQTGVRAWVRMQACACTCASARVRTCACAHLCLRALVHVHSCVYTHALCVCVCASDHACLRDASVRIYARTLVGVLNMVSP